MRPVPRAWIVLPIAAITASYLGCNTAAVLAPRPALRAASASNLAIDVEFAESLDKTSAQDASHYLVYPTGSGSPASVVQAALIDTLYGRVVRLSLQDPVQGFLPDSTDYAIQTSAVITLAGKSTGTRSVVIRTGLNYDTPMQNLFAIHCDSCHGPARVDGSYRTDTYSALFGPGTSPSPNVIAGDPNCLLVVKTKPSNSMFRLGNLTFLDSEIIHNWVVSYQARP
ncbi:MAG TPA: hypothetical protein VER38_05640 [Candidatus Eisenbacteria bacterium]|nr:hypothetical protein [Candidatus Eisenbacteria bacterium]